MTVAEWILLAAAIYLLAGVIFGLPFVALWVDRIDRAAAGAPIGFRLLILPGAVALWPLLLSRLLWWSKAPPTERNAHRRGPEPER